MAVTLRVYKAGKKYDGCVDQYSLYYPTPQNKVNDWGYKGVYLGFSFSQDGIIKCTHEELSAGSKVDACLGKKVKIESLPQHVQDWITEEQKSFNIDLILESGNFSKNFLKKLGFEPVTITKKEWNAFICKRNSMILGSEKL